MPGYQYRGTQPDVELAVKDRVTPAIPRATQRTTRKDPAVVTTKPASAKMPVWEEPPAEPARGRKAQTAATIEILKRNPGKWARVKDGLKSSSAAASWKKLGCEAVSRRIGDTYSGWARWPETKA